MEEVKKSACCEVERLDVSGNAVYVSVSGVNGGVTVWAVTEKEGRSGFEDVWEIRCFVG